MQYIITADVFNGKIYKTSIKTKSTEIIYSHKYGANAAREDSTGSVWFTQSTENQNEERLFMALGGQPRLKREETIMSKIKIGP